MFDNFEALLQQSGVNLLQGQSVESLENKVRQYFVELLKWNQKINLVSRGDANYRLAYHFFDSLHYIHDLPEVGKGLDIGSGAGFPGIPVKLLRPELEIHLVESQRKRAGFLSHVIRTLGLSCIEAIWDRAENLVEEEEYQRHFDFVVFKAVSTLEACLQLGLPFLKPCGILILKKEPEIEIGMKNRACKIVNERIVTSLDGVRSMMMVFQKCST